LEWVELSRLLIASKPKARRNRRKLTAGFVGVPHLVVHAADGSFEIPSLPVSVDALRRHAERYGTDGVLEVAEAALDQRAVARLRVELDAIDRERAPRFATVKTRRRSTVETKAAVLALRADGLVPGVIADKLGVSDATVRRHLKAA